MAWIEECLKCMQQANLDSDFGSKADAELTERGWVRISGQGWVCRRCAELLEGIEQAVGGRDWVICFAKIADIRQAPGDRA